MSVVDNVHVTEQDARVAVKFFRPVKRLEGRLDAVEADAKSAFETVEAAKAYIETAEANIESVRSESTEAVQELLKLSHGLRQDVEQLLPLLSISEKSEQTMEWVKGQLDFINNRINAVQAVVEVSKDLDEKHSSKIADLEAAFLDAQVAIDSNATAQTSLALQVKEMDSRHSSLITANEQKVEKLSQERDQLAQSIHTNMLEETSKLSKAIEAQQQEAAAGADVLQKAIQASEAGIEQLRNSQKDLGEQVSRALDLHKGLQVAMKRMDGKLEAMQVDMTNLKMQVGS